MVIAGSVYAVLTTEFSVVYVCPFAEHIVQLINYCDQKVSFDLIVLAHRLN